jgi:hypothetical protein
MYQLIDKPDQCNLRFPLSGIEQYNNNKRDDKSHRRKKTTERQPYSLFVLQERTVTDV